MTMYMEVSNNAKISNYFALVHHSFICLIMSEMQSEGASSAASSAAAGEEVDIDLADPEVEKAALKIQAQFKGLKAGRKKSSTPSKVSLFNNNFSSWWLIF